MASLNAHSWRELKRKSPSECPKLFYKLNIQHHRLDLHLTDLVAIWRCNLSKSAILQLAKGQHASIDPSESTLQLEVLLRKLGQSLASSNNQLTHGESEDFQVVHLTTKLTLPKPLQPLKWTFELVTQPTDEFAEQLLRPCLLEASVSRHKIASLQQVVKDKDHVISRLLEKIEANGTDLSLIFPGITGLRPRRGRVTASEAQNHVPGMAAFSPDAWSQRFENDNPYAFYESQGIDNLVAGCERCPRHTPKQHSDWLKRLPKHVEVENDLEDSDHERSSKKASQRPQVSDDDDEATASEEEFEKRPTPPYLRQNTGLASVSHENSTSPPAKTAKSNSIETALQYGTTPQQLKLEQSPSIVDKTDQPGQERISENAASRDTIESGSETDDLDVSNRSTKVRNPPDSNFSRRAQLIDAQEVVSKEREDSGRAPKPARLSLSASPPPPSSPSISKPSALKRRLGRIGKRSMSPEETGSSSLVADSKQKRSSDETTGAHVPNRRRLGRINQKVSPQPVADFETTPSVEGTKNADSDTKMRDIDSDATSSPPPSISRSPSRTESTLKRTSQAVPSTAQVRLKSEQEHKSDGGSGSRPEADCETKHESEANTEIELTAEQKANKRREELKKKTDVTGGVKKKRKF